MPLPTLILLTLAPQTPPRLLVAPLVSAKKGSVPSPGLANHFAALLDDDGRTFPIVWGLSDPVFRPQALEGKLGNVPDLPTRDEALGVARRLGASYVLLYRSERKNGNLDASAELVQDGRTVWRDQKSMSVKLGDQQSDDDTVASIARTWVELLTTKGGPLKALAPKKTVATPPPTPGQNPVVISTPPSRPPTVPPKAPNKSPDPKTPPKATVPKATDPKSTVSKVPDPKALDPKTADPKTPDPKTPDPKVSPPKLPERPTTNLDDLDARIDALMKQGKPAAARAAARDAVDADPLTPGPRMALVRLLSAQGDAEGAAEEARRAADLMPDQSALRIDAARRLLAIGRTKEAQEQANELRARRPDNPDARRLSAEVALALDDASTAAREMEALLKSGEDAQAHLLRGIARARLGGAEGAAADLKAWADATPSGPAKADGYAFAERSLGAMAQKAADGILPLLQRAAAQPKSGAVRDELDEAQRQAQARAAAFAALPTEGTAARHDAWALAHRLMALVAADLRAFLAEGGEDALTSARLDLGEAKRAMGKAELGS